MNKVFLIGNLTRDPELRTTQSGIACCQFSIAVNRRFKSADGVQEVDYINVVTWRQLAESSSKYLAKGKKVAVVGSIQTRTYEGKDGNKRHVTEVIASEVEFLTPKGAEAKPADSGNPGTTPQPPQQNHDAYAGFTSVDDEELPF